MNGIKYKFNVSSKSLYQECNEKKEHVNFFDQKKNKFGYVFSDDFYTSKFSNDYALCTGVLLLGNDRNNRQLSFLSHQNTKFLSSLENTKQKKLFQKNLEEKTKKFLDLSAQEVIVVFLGGVIYQLFNSIYSVNGISNDDMKKYNEMYLNFISFLSDTIQKIDSSIKPNICPPKIGGFCNNTDVFFDTENSTVWISDFNLNATIYSFENINKKITT